MERLRPVDLTTKAITGSEALAQGALDAGVQFVTGYPGSPSTATVEALLRRGDGVRVEWAINEKSAFDAAFGASLAGVRSFLCLKSVGLNVALDSLMVSNLAAGPGGFVILVGDDPGGWGSQNEEDSRLLVAAAEVPLLEPTVPDQARPVIVEAFQLSASLQVPVVVRITRALALDRVVHLPPAVSGPSQAPLAFRRQQDRFNVLPIHVVDFHRRLQAKLEDVQGRFEASPWNAEEGSGKQGIIAAGHAYQKLFTVLAGGPAASGSGPAASAAAPKGRPAVRVLRLSTLHPLPTQRLLAFLRQLDAALVLEETAPYVEIEVQAIAQRAGLTLPIYGRHSRHVPAAGELSAPDIASALAAILPEWEPPPLEEPTRAMPSRQPLCQDCPYVPAFEALLAVMDEHGGRDAFVITGETGCMVRAQLPPWEMMDVKYGMGSSIGLAAGLARSGIPQQIVALSGDSAFLHSGLGELIDAVQARVKMLVVVLVNETTALSGGQPHAATGHDAQGRPRQPVDLVALVRATGANLVAVVDPDDTTVTWAALQRALALDGLSVVVVQQACPRLQDRATS
jgi:indolepyruvate ferredoxin oxidoreductase alpha subunit